ncbi:anti sigma factor C-terminal domain-containing protein [Mesobacillus foraminis]|uniref:anti sigma factor C-terminal domain-containing protein n=1 Tax=Mesobacillus foraminis TaxID=279826 RepID=UPI0039A33897
MVEKNEDSLNTEKELDFISSPSLQMAVKKSRRKQTIKYVIIAFLTSAFLLTALFLGSQYFLNKRLQADQEKGYMRTMVQGANVTGEGTYFIHNLFSVLAVTREYKQIGDRQIVWDQTTKKVPLFGRVSIIEQGSGLVSTQSMNAEANRVVRYNEYTNERRIDFYYPGLAYDFLPKEIEIAASMDDNKLIEVALSFEKPMTLTELSSRLGHENINWLWVDTTTSAQRSRMSEELPDDSLRVKGGGRAYGFSVNKENPYTAESGKGFLKTMEQLSKSRTSVKAALKGIKENAVTMNGELLVSGAVVTGAAEELQRFKDLQFIRASVLGATIDQY